MFMTTQAQGKAIINGASSGIGFSYADRLAQRGFDLVLVACDQARLEALATDLCAKHSINVEVVKADLTQPADLSVLEQRSRSDASITLLLNNALLPGATRTEIRERAGLDINAFPPEIVMDVNEMVDASLAGFDQKELITIPSLPDAAHWQAFIQARLALGPNLSLQHAAQRYKTAGA
jgi:short-subunit dehydrogenase